jgi:hypothetical protein
MEDLFTLQYGPTRGCQLFGLFSHGAPSGLTCFSVKATLLRSNVPGTMVATMCVCKRCATFLLDARRHLDEAARHGLMDVAARVLHEIRL